MATLREDAEGGGRPPQDFSTWNLKERTAAGIPQRNFLVVSREQQENIVLGVSPNWVFFFEGDPTIYSNVEGPLSSGNDHNYLQGLNSLVPY